MAFLNTLINNNTIIVPSQTGDIFLYLINNSQATYTALWSTNKTHIKFHSTSNSYYDVVGSKHMLTTDSSGISNLEIDDIPIFINGKIDIR